ncbi:cold-shock protein [Aerococcus urinaehominis]|uniref:Cold-shock protein n=1 Tax=Aerococcus urinaehominis TaxID=128944 RepID=A0A109RGQ0_9LACT|nr:cold shock domain-containing protein [Aerococcus urinaehominis]AMB99670.1 cold-shock protein [Aerococcus urinaehominis]SDL89744.1 cold shock protein (beta-ribbon, CspA family) [Aerococcus urinaehominis]
MFLGQVKSYDPKRGYGFITIPNHPEEGEVFVQRQAFAHTSLDQLVVGQEVYLEIAEGKQGPQAVNLQIK